MGGLLPALLAQGLCLSIFHGGFHGILSGLVQTKNYKFRTDTSHKIYLLAQEGVATLPRCESTKMLITQACKSLNAVCEAKQSTQLEMQRLAAMLPEYEVVMQMEGAGPITGPALMAEIGDVRRFKTRKRW